MHRLRLRSQWPDGAVTMVSETENTASAVGRTDRHGACLATGLSNSIPGAGIGSPVLAGRRNQDHLHAAAAFACCPLTCPDSMKAEPRHRRDTPCARLAVNPPLVMPLSQVTHHAQSSGNSGRSFRRHGVSCEGHQLTYDGGAGRWRRLSARVPESTALRRCTAVTRTCRDIPISLRARGRGTAPPEPPEGATDRYHWRGANPRPYAAAR